MLKVDVELIKQRKSQYGSNFESIARKWSTYLNTDKETDGPVLVAKMMALMKEARIEAIFEKMKELDPFDDKLELVQLECSLIDSRKDQANYLWIANNYKEYQEL
jgi:hypothetical protein